MNEETIGRVVDGLKRYYDVIPREDLYQEAWVFFLENPLKDEEALKNHLKHLIRKEIKRRKIEVPLDSIAKKQ